VEERIAFGEKNFFYCEHLRGQGRKKKRHFYCILKRQPLGGGKIKECAGGELPGLDVDG